MTGFHIDGTMLNDEERALFTRVIVGAATGFAQGDGVAHGHDHDERAKTAIKFAAAVVREIRNQIEGTPEPKYLLTLDQKAVDAFCFKEEGQKVMQIGILRFMQKREGAVSHSEIRVGAHATDGSILALVKRGLLNVEGTEA